MHLTTTDNADVRRAIQCLENELLPELTAINEQLDALWQSMQGTEVCQMQAVTYMCDVLRQDLQATICRAQQFLAWVQKVDDAQQAERGVMAGEIVDPALATVPPEIGGEG